MYCLSYIGDVLFLLTFSREIIHRVKVSVWGG